MESQISVVIAADSGSYEGKTKGSYLLEPIA